MSAGDTRQDDAIINYFKLLNLNKSNTRIPATLYKVPGVKLSYQFTLQNLSDYEDYNGSLYH